MDWLIYLVIGIFISAYIFIAGAVFGCACENKHNAPFIRGLLWPIMGIAWLIDNM